MTGMLAGHRFGPYEIVSRIGAGGMGEVWRAKDTRLDRQVAIKVLSTEFAANAQLKLRFEREAKLISSLNHPHICTLYDVGIEDGTNYLVMELIEGESLADRLTRGPLPIHEVLRFGGQIAEALDKAHRQQVVHRDLKPGNIMLTKSGAKLLDFGLAKMSALNISTDEATQQKPLTQEGTILGTFQYMAPEQLEGQDADPRSDIFAFGTVVYEMATAKRAFEGKNRTSLIAAIVTGQPAPISSLQPLTPPALEHVIDKCLAKDPEDRWQSAHDVAEELRWIGEAGSKAGVAAPILSRKKFRDRLWMAAALVMTLVAIALASALALRRPRAVVSVTSELTPPAGLTYRFEKDDAGSLSISPDGRLIVFGAEDEKGAMKLWVRPIDDRRTRPIEGTDDATYPFWSPDGRSVAFFSGGKLKRVDLSGGPPSAICEVGAAARGGSWGSQGTIIFEPRWREPIWSVPAGGGTPGPVTRIDASRSETTHRYPWFLPDGKHFLYLAGSHIADSNSDLNAIYVAALGSPDRKLVLHARSNAVYSAGYLIFVRQQYLLAQKFNLDKLEISGEPIKLADDVHYEAGFFRGVFAAGGDATVVYHPGGIDPREQLTWIDRSGKELGVVGEPEDFQDVRFSPDGNKFVATIGDTSDLWIYDLPHSSRSRFTSDPMNEGLGVWSPDARNIVFSFDRGGLQQLYLKSTDGTSPEQLLLASNYNDAPSDWSRDGRFIAVDRNTPGRPETHVFLLPMTGDRKAIPFQPSRFNSTSALFSHNSRWVSFLSDESGRQELYVAPLPGPGPKQQVSTKGARTSGGWSPNDDHLLYVAPDRTLMSVKVRAGESFDYEPPVVVGLFPKVAATDSPDTEKFLVALRKNYTVPPLVLITNWTSRSPRAQKENE